MPRKQLHHAGYDAREPQDIVIAMFDVLGFKSMVKQVPLEQLNEEYRTLLLLKQRAGVVPVLSPSGVDEWQSASAVFSDTIVFWARANIDGIQSLLATCSILIANALDAGWPVRGGIAAGSCVMDRDARVFIGEPIVNAYLLQEAQEWIGAAIHPTCNDHPVVRKVIRSDTNVYKYPVPLKSTCSENVNMAIEWASRAYEPLQTLERLRASAGDSVLKYNNAIEYVRATQAIINAKAPNRSGV